MSEMSKCDHCGVETICLICHTPKILGRLVTVCQDCYDAGLPGATPAQVEMLEYEEMLEDKEEHPELYIEPKPEPKRLQITFDIYDYFIISARLAGQTLNDIALDVTNILGHNISYQAVQHRIAKIIRFKSEIEKYATTTKRVDIATPSLIDDETYF